MEEGAVNEPLQLAYAGVGSRRTPPDVLALMTKVARTLRRQGWTLRSGHAPGADQAFEAGAGADAEIYLPWPSFETGVSTHGAKVIPRPSDVAFEVAEQYHPFWLGLGKASRSLHARNMHQVLGEWLETPSAFVICWTPDGSLDGSGCGSGGTGQALRAAAAEDVHVFNLNLDVDRTLFERIAADQLAMPSVT
jgi:hypothetical protein